MNLPRGGGMPGHTVGGGVWKYCKEYDYIIQNMLRQWRKFGGWKLQYGGGDCTYEDAEQAIADACQLPPLTEKLLA